MSLHVSPAGSPFSVPVRDVVDPSKVKCSGPGLGDGVKAHLPQTFTVDSTQAGQAKLEVSLTGPSGKRNSTYFTLLTHAHAQA